MNNEMMENIRKKVGNIKLRPLKAIRLYCKEQCCAGDEKSWKGCTFIACFLHKYRFGKLNIPLNKDPNKNKQEALMNLAKNELPGEKQEII